MLEKLFQAPGSLHVLHIQILHTTLNVIGKITEEVYARQLLQLVNANHKIAQSDLRRRLVELSHPEVVSWHIVVLRPES